MSKRTINVMIEDLGDDRTYVSSIDLPGLILAGRDRMKILAAIEPAARALLERKGEDASDLMINATFVSQPGSLARSPTEPTASSPAGSALSQRLPE